MVAASAPCLPTPTPWITVTDTASADDAWDCFVESVPGAPIEQTTMWAETKQRIGIDCVRVRALHADGSPAAGALLQIKSVAPGVKVGYVPYGPIVDPVHPTAAEAVLDGLELAVRQLHLCALVVQPGRSSPFVGDPRGSAPDGGRPTWLEVALRERGYDPAPVAVAPEATVELDLTIPYDALAEGLSSSRRRVKKEADPAVSFMEVHRDDDLETFHRLYDTSAERQGFTGVSLPYLRGQWDVLHPRGRARLFFACYEGEPLCGLFGTAFAGNFTPRLTGWTGEHRSLRLPERLRWRVICAMRDEGFARYNQGGVERGFLTALAEGRRAEAIKAYPSSHYKYSFGGAAISSPGPYQLVVNPVLRAAVRRLLPVLTGSPRLQAMANRWKSG
jgi:lipid II:glycine glycyltransferase (peptidoglycan interpeptide bridge formation enzyme)